MPVLHDLVFSSASPAEGGVLYNSLSPQAPLQMAVPPLGMPGVSMSADRLLEHMLCITVSGEFRQSCATGVSRMMQSLVLRIYFCSYLDLNGCFVSCNVGTQGCTCCVVCLGALI